jgi:HAD superfamily hydrolase (TIGR01509 family)
MRAILFDFGGTLDSPTHWLDRFLAQYRAAGIEISRSELDRAFDAATRLAYAARGSLDRYGLREIVEYLVHAQFASLAREGPNHLREVIRIDADIEARRRAERIIEGFVAETRSGMERNRRLLSALSERFKLGLVSNFYGNLESVIAEAELAAMFSAIADSGRLGVYKPDAGIFEAALAALDVTAAEAVMVGDSLEKDCAPARRLGMTTVWFAPQGSVGREHIEAVAHFTIDGLEQLKELEWAKDSAGQ